MQQPLKSQTPTHLHLEERLCHRGRIFYWFTYSTSHYPQGPVLSSIFVIGVGMVSRVKKTNIIAIRSASLVHHATYNTISWHLGLISIMHDDRLGHNDMMCTVTLGRIQALLQWLLCSTSSSIMPNNDSPFFCWAYINLLSPTDR
jgi:hypothetical protein